MKCIECGAEKRLSQMAPLRKDGTGLCRNCNRRKYIEYGAHTTGWPMSRWHRYMTQSRALTPEAEAEMLEQDSRDTGQ